MLEYKLFHRTTKMPHRGYMLAHEGPGGAKLYSLSGKFLRRWMARKY